VRLSMVGTRIPRYDPDCLDRIAFAVLERAIQDTSLVEVWRARDAMRWLASDKASVFFDGMGLEQAEIVRQTMEMMNGTDRRAKETD